MCNHALGALRVAGTDLPSLPDQDNSFAECQSRIDKTVAALQAVRANQLDGKEDSQVTVTVGFTTFPGEIWASPRSWVEAVYPGLAYFNEADRGGHFAAWEEPQLFSEEVRAAFRSLR